MCTAASCHRSWSSREPRNWRTHDNAFLEHCSEVEAMLVAAPALEAKTLFAVLVGKYPGRYADGQLRTLQRRVKSWCRIMRHFGIVRRWQDHQPLTRLDGIYAREGIAN